MNKTVGLSGLVGLMAALNVSCGTHKPHTGKLDEKTNNVNLLGESSPVNAVGSESQAPAPQPHTQAPTSESQAPESQSHAAAPQSQAPAPQSQAPAPQSQAPAPQAQAPAPQAQAPAPQAQAPAPQSQALAPGMQVMSPSAQETLPALPIEQVWQQESQAQDQSLSAMQNEASPWDAAQQNAGAQLSSSSLPNQQSGVDQQPSEGSRLERLNRDQAFDKVNQLFATEGRDGVLAYTEKNLLSLEKDLNTLGAEDAAQYQQKLERSRAQWQTLRQVSEDLDFVQQAADLLSDLSDVAQTMANLGRPTPQT